MASPLPPFQTTASAYLPGGMSDETNVHHEQRSTIRTVTAQRDLYTDHNYIQFNTDSGPSTLPGSHIHSAVPVTETLPIMIPLRLPAEAAVLEQVLLQQEMFEHTNALLQRSVDNPLAVLNEETAGQLTLLLLGLFRRTEQHGFACVSEHPNRGLLNQGEAIVILLREQLRVYRRILRLYCYAMHPETSLYQFVIENPPVEIEALRPLINSIVENPGSSLQLPLSKAMQAIERICAFYIGNNIPVRSPQMDISNVLLRLRQDVDSLLNMLNAVYGLKRYFLYGEQVPATYPYTFPAAQTQPEARQ